MDLGFLRVTRSLTREGRHHARLCQIFRSGPRCAAVGGQSGIYSLLRLSVKFCNDPQPRHIR